jgi:hypothetical protein
MKIYLFLTEPSGLSFQILFLKDGSYAYISCLRGPSHSEVCYQLSLGTAALFARSERTPLPTPSSQMPPVVPPLLFKESRQLCSSQYHTVVLRTHPNTRTPVSNFARKLRDRLHSRLLRKAQLGHPLTTLIG